MGFTGIMGLMSLAMFVLVFVLRTHFRNRFQIPGSGCDDCCCSFWCNCCVLAQMDHHLGTTKNGGWTFSEPGTVGSGTISADGYAPMAGRVSVVAAQPGSAGAYSAV